MTLRALILIFFLVLSGGQLYAQASTTLPPGQGTESPDLIKLITPESNESKKTEVDVNKAFQITETQKKLIRKVLDVLSDREVDEYLRSMGISTSGSIYVKRQRLRDAVVSKDEKVKDQPQVPGLPPKKEDQPFVIENASEGELLSVDKTKSGVLILRGKVRLKLAQGTLTADSISIDSKRNEIYAEGGIDYKDQALNVKGDKFIYDLNFQRGVVYDTKASLYPSYFVGKKLRKIDESRYVLDMGYFTACGAEVPHYSFKAKKIVVYQDQSVVATNLRFKVGQTDLFWLPLYYSSNLGSGWVFQAGKNQTQGVFVQTAYQWSEPTAVTGLLNPVGRKVKLDFYEKTGEAAGLDLWKVSPWLNYNLETGLANYRFNQITSVYEDRFRLGGISNTVVTNQVDKGEFCAEVGGKCIAPLSDILRAQNPNFNQSIRDVGHKNQTWHKINLNANARSNNIPGDGTRNFQVRLEEYSNPRFDFEFGYRYEPANTLRSLYTRRQQRNPFLRQNTVWTADYSQTHGDLTVNMSARRNYTYWILSPSDRSDFFPTYEELPRTSIRNSSLVTTVPYFNSPVYWDVNFNNVIKRFYNSPNRKTLAVAVPSVDAYGRPLTDSSGNVIYTTNDPYGRYGSSLARSEIDTMAETGFRSSFNFGSYVSFTPALYYGFQKRTYDRGSTAQTQDVARERELKRESYLFTRHNHRVSVGVPALLFSSTYRWVDGSKSELPDKVLMKGRDRVREVEFALESNALEDLEFSVRTIRDLREFASDYNPQVKPKERWYFTIARIGAFYDFYEGFGKKRETLLERKRSFYSGIFLNNDYVYHTAQSSPLYNQATLSFKMGGFSVWFIRNFKNLEIGGTWFHVFANSRLENLGVYGTTYNQQPKYSTTRNPFLDSYRFFVQTDVQLTRDFGMEVELDSRVTQPWRYTNQVGEDAIFRNGTDLSSAAYYYQQSTSANTALQPTTPERDLVNGLGLNGATARQSTAFNINRFILVGKYNLHNFEYRLGYAMDLRAISGGPSLDSMITFYDQSIFFSVNLVNVNMGPEESSSQMSRARLYRFKKRPLDAGYNSGVSAEAQ